MWLGDAGFPYATQSAPKLTIDTLILYAAGPSGGIIPSTPLNANPPIVLNGPAGSATLSLPSDSKVMIRDLTQQVFLVLRLGAPGWCQPTPLAVIPGR